METARCGWRVAARAAVLAAVVVGCGSEEAPVEEPAASASSGFEQPPRRKMDVSGLMGVIPERKIHGTLEPKLPKFQRCFFHGAGDVEFIGGHFKFYFRVGLDGRVEWVSPRGSSVGHRGTEQCLLEEAARTRFPEPRGGGAAEFVWGFELDPVGGVRPPVDWEAERVAPVVSANAASIEACGAGGSEYVVTAYVAPGGQVLAAGAASDSHEADAHIDCLVEAVRSWQMPDPGSYAAKVSFRLP